MMQDWILTAIRKRCRRRIAGWLLAFAGAAAGIVHVYFLAGAEQGGPSRSTAALVLAILGALMLMPIPFRQAFTRSWSRAAIARCTWRGAAGGRRRSWSS
jgi:hypothetical protein